MAEQKFTPRAENVLRLAQEAAGELGHGYVGCEHLLLALVREDGGVACRALTDAGVTEHAVREEIIRLVGRGLSGSAPSQGLTPRARSAVELAVAEAMRFGSPYIGTEHLLLGLLRDGGNMALRILASLGVPTRRLYGAVVQKTNDLPRAAAKESGKPRGEGEGRRGRVLAEHTRDLTEQARAGQLDPVIGRAQEIERTIRILTRRTKNNPVLLGEPGVGKTAIAEGIAQKIAAAEVPEELMHMRLLSLDLAGMVAGTKYRGEFEERIRALLDEVRRAGNILLFIDELHTIVGAGSAEGAVDAANIIKPALGRGEIRVIGATTLTEYRKYIEKDAALARRFQTVLVAEPTAEQSVQILTGLRAGYEEHHRVCLTDGALEAAVTLSRRYLPMRFLPDKAIDLMDEAASRVRMEGGNCAGAEDIACVVSDWTGIPLARLTEYESARLLRLEETLHRRVVGQEEAVCAVARAVRRARSGVKDPGRPSGSFLFLGPSGVGKTELCRALAEALFGEERAMIRFDMSEYTERHTVSRLLGAPPGYVGCEEGGQLTEQVRRRPYALVLFDEIEKAHEEVWNLLLQILEDGTLTDAQGRRVDFRNTLIVMTSNVGAKAVGAAEGIGFVSGGAAEEFARVRERAMEEVRRTFKPELINRMDEIVVFRRLTQEDAAEIVRRMLTSVAQRAAPLGIRLCFDEAAVEWLARRGYDSRYGARSLRRLICTEVEDALAEQILGGQLRRGDCAEVSAAGEVLTVHAQCCPALPAARE